MLRLKICAKSAVFAKLKTVMGKFDNHSGKKHRHDKQTSYFFDKILNEVNMKKVIIGLISATAICTTSCKNNQAETIKETNIVNDSLIAETLTEVNLLDILKQQKIETDSFISQNPKNLTVLVKLTDHPDLFKVENENFPESYDIETTFNIIKDNTGKIIYACEIPQSQSGDWFVVLNYYFDDNGKTFAFEKQTNEFNSGCAEITYETKTEYYNNDFKSIGSDYKLVDDKKKELRKKDCDLMDYEYKVVSNADSFIKTNKIKKTHKVYTQNYSGIEQTVTKTNSKEVNIHIKNYISACIEVVDDFTPYSNHNFVNIWNLIFGNNQNIINKLLLKQQLSEVLTNKERRDLFFKGHLKYLGDKSHIFMNIDGMNNYSYTQFDSGKVTDYIIENYVN